MICEPPFLLPDDMEVGKGPGKKYTCSSDLLFKVGRHDRFQSYPTQQSWIRVLDSKF